MERDTDGGGGLFTVVIPAYNPGDFLREALESVAGQSVPAEWVVVVDDGSVDGTFDAANRWISELALRGEVLRQSNQGISAARNAGLARRRTAVIALLDADDVWLPNHLANLAKAYALCPDAVVVFGDSRYFGDSRSRTALLAEQAALAFSDAIVEDRIHRLSPAVFERLLPGLFFAPSAASFRIDDRRETRFATDLRVGEDRYLFLQLARRGRFVYVNEQTCCSRRHATNTTHSDRYAWLNRQAMLVLDKVRRDVDLALTPREVEIVDASQRRAAEALVYESSAFGVRACLRAYLAARHWVPWKRALRVFARAAVVSVGAWKHPDVGPS